jgi:oligopeptide transport system ATP-binding protein
MSKQAMNQTGTKEVLLEVRNLKKYFPITRGVFKRKVGDIKAVDGISFSIHKGETIGLVGESGCGKTVAARSILQIYQPTAGEVYFDNVNLATTSRRELQQFRRRMAPIFQNPYSSLDPRMPIGRIISEPMDVHHLYNNKKERRARVEEILTLVGLAPVFAERYPLEFSGGQRQRVGIARALASNPEFIVCDDPISALDVSIQAQIVNLLQDLQEQFGVTYLFIAQDLSMLRYICDRLMMMYLGKIVEIADRIDLYDNPLHPYTQAVLSAVPIPDPEVEAKRKRIPIDGELPDPANPPKGCNFCTRCPQVMEICEDVDPEIIEMSDGHWVACHLYDDPSLKKDKPI